MSSRSDPFEELERLMERMSRQFEEASTPWRPTESVPMLGGGVDAMPMDVATTDDEYVVTVDLPGFDRDDVEVRVTDDTLHITAERERELDEEAADFVRRERSFERASRSIDLPESVDADAVSARMRSGVLTVRVPRLELDESKRIEIG